MSQKLTLQVWPISSEGNNTAWFWCGPGDCKLRKWIAKKWTLNIENSGTPMKNSNRSTWRTQCFTTMLTVSVTFHFMIHCAHFSKQIPPMKTWNLRTGHGILSCVAKSFGAREPYRGSQGMGNMSNAARVNWYGEIQRWHRIRGVSRLGFMIDLPFALILI